MPAATPGTQPPRTQSSAARCCPANLQPAARGGPALSGLRSGASHAAPLSPRPGGRRRPRTLTVALGAVGHAEEQGGVTAELRGKAVRVGRGDMTFFDLGKFLNSGFLNLSTVDVWGQVTFGCGGPSCAAFTSISVLCPLSIIAFHQLCNQNCLRALLFVSWGCIVTPVENHCLNCFGV